MNIKCIHEPQLFELQSEPELYYAALPAYYSAL